MSREREKLVIGTRGSDLALWQTRHAASRIKAETEIRIVRTTGDRILDLPLHEVGGMGLFTNEIEAWLKDRRIDLAVHSLKDLPVLQPPGLVIGAVLERGPISDMLLIREECHDENAALKLKEGCTVGASSLRRQAMLRLHAPGAASGFIRGNVPTRLEKLMRGDFGAVIIARAGLERLGLDISHFVAYELNPYLWLPAPGQGAIAVELRSDDSWASAEVAALDHKPTRDAVSAERALLDYFGVGCHAPFGALVEIEGASWCVRAGMEIEGVWRSVKAAADEPGKIAAMVGECFERGDYSNQQDEQWLLRPYIV